MDDACKTTACQSCGVVSLDNQKCARCRSVVYCSRGCQKSDWNKGGHKKVCEQIAGKKRSKNKAKEPMPELGQSGRPAPAVNREKAQKDSVLLAQNAVLVAQAGSSAEHAAAVY